MKGIVSCSLAVMALSVGPLAHAQSAIHVAAADNTRVVALVPAGVSAEEACRGFRDLSECSAALHVAQNLNIPFMELRYRLIAGQSLTNAIHALAPTVDPRREAERAERQARADLAAQG